MRNAMTSHKCLHGLDGLGRLILSQKGAGSNPAGGTFLKQFLISSAERLGMAVLVQRVSE